MAETPKVKSKFDLMKESIAAAAAKRPVVNPARAVPKDNDKIATRKVTTPPARKSDKPGRSAKARDQRAKHRGRLPIGYCINAEWTGREWTAYATAYANLPPEKGGRVWEHVHRADGLFRLMEEVDTLFWEWVAANPAEAAKLEWPTADVKPEPYPEAK